MKPFADPLRSRASGFSWRSIRSRSTWLIYVIGLAIIVTRVNSSMPALTQPKPGQ